jgi:glycosyltransferase involved in cell wall biosynthesis
MQARGTRAILAHYGPTALSLLPVARRAGVPLWVYFHGYDVWRARERRRYAPGYPALFREMAGAFAASQTIANQLQEWGAPAEKVHYLPCGVQEAFLQARHHPTLPPRILFAARWAATKGLFTLLEAYLQVLEARPDVVLTLAGDGPLRRQVLQRLKQLNLADRVELPGVLSREALLAAMERSHVAILPSERAADGDSEGTPLFLLEAAAAGLPVVATAHQGIGEVFVHGRHALLVPEKKPAALADALLDVLNHPQAARIRADEARHWVTSQCRMSTQWDQIITYIGLT